VQREAGDADAGADIQWLLLEHDGLLERAECLCQSRLPSSAPTGRHQQREFIATEPRDAAGRPISACSRMADLAQHVIADPVPERIVDEFEAIQIHDQDRQRLALRFAPRRYPL
jgi:hypothetical protein